MSCRSQAAGLTIGVLYYNEEEALVATLREWASWPAALQSRVTDGFIELAVVDDGSQDEKAAVKVIQRFDGALPPIRVLTVGKDIPWNIAGARNLLFHSASHEWVLALDDDYIAPMVLIDDVLSQIDAASLKPAIYRFQRNGLPDKPVHPGIMLTRAATWWAFGGADEDFVGHYGMTDPHLVYRANKAGISVEIFPSSGRLEPVDEDTPRTRDARVNKELMDRKTSGTVPWSTSYLRFSWSDQSVMDQGA
jgi:GT2 family glycosyltransferase